MNLKQLKTAIENKTLNDDLIIFKVSDNDFIANQYRSEISKISNKEIEYIDSLTPFIQSNDDLFNDNSLEQFSTIKVLREDVFIYSNVIPSALSGIIVITNKFHDKQVEKDLQSYIVELPKLEPWQIKDYVYSIAEGVDTKDLDWLLSLCSNNIFRLQQELDKITIFSKNERKYLFTDLIRDGALDDLTPYNIFNFTGAITSKNIPQLLGIYENINSVDINEFGLLKILIQNFKNLILVQLNSNPTTESTGLESKQLWAIKKQPRCYSPEQLLNIFTFLCDIDRQVKEGELPTEIMRDYMIIKILSM